MRARLEEVVESALPCGPSLHLLALGVDEVPVELTAASINVHLSSAEPALLLPEITGEPESGNDEGSKVGREEVRGGTNLLAILETDGRDSSVELR